MPRTRRIYLEDAIYYVTLEGPSHDQVFHEKADYLKYLELLATCKAEHRFKLFSYVLLPNSIVLLMEPNPEFPVSEVMQKMTPKYTRYYNAKYHRSGHLFPKRFRSVYVEKKPYLARLTRFIHSLPEHIQKESTFNEYPYSSYAAFLKAAAHDSPCLEEVQEVTSYLSRDTSYDHFMNSQAAEEFEFLEKKLLRRTVLGTKPFEQEVRARLKGVEAAKEVVTVQGSGAGASPMYAFRKTTLALSGLLVAVVFLSAYSVHLNSQAPVQNLPVSSEAGVLKAAPPAEKTETEMRAEGPGLTGTIWEVELISVSPDGTKRPIRDRIRFMGKNFESNYFLSQGFNRSNYTVTVGKNGVVTWETMQMNDRGETLSWHGDWQGDKMEGVMSYRPAGQNPLDFSFMSNQFGVQK